MRVTTAPTTTSEEVRTNFSRHFIQTGVNAMIQKIFSQKNRRQEIGCFDSKGSYLCKNNNNNIGFQENLQYFFAKIGQKL
jgi:hypothetical protein